MSAVTLGWILPSTRVDASALTAQSIDHINIYDAIGSGSTVQIGVAPGTATTFTTGVLGQGKHVFSAIVVDTAGNASASSVLGSVTVTAAAPSPATGGTAVLSVASVSA